MTQYVSKITLPNGQTYNIKDEAAWTFMNTEFRKEIVSVLPDYNNMSSQELVQALHTIYLMPSTDPDQAGQNVYDEYVLVQHTDTNPYTYTWELIGTTGTNLTNFSEKGHTHEVTPMTEVADHTFTVTGDTPVPTFTGTQGTVNASGSVTNGDVTINIASSSGTGTAYTPAGSLSGRTETESSHTHTIGKTKKFIDYDSIYELKDGQGVSVQSSPTASATYTKMAQVADSQTSIQKYTVSNGSVTVTPSTGDRADGTLTDLTNNVRTNAVFNDATVNNETLSFTLKDLNKSTTVTGIASATTTAKNVVANGTEDFYACKDGTGKTVHDYTYGDGTLTGVAQVGSKKRVVTGLSATETSTATEAVVADIDTNTGAGTAHSHNLSTNAVFSGVQKKFSGSITNGSVTVSGSFTPSGTLAFPEGEGEFESDPITLVHNVNNPTVTSAPDTFDQESHIYDWYGIEWGARFQDPHVTRIGNTDMHRSLPIQTAMRRCLLDVKGVLYNYLDQYDSRYYAPGSKDAQGHDIGGQSALTDMQSKDYNVMVEVPAHWFTLETATVNGDTIYRAKISPYAQTGWAGLGKFYVGAFQGTIDGTCLMSHNASTPTFNVNLGEYRAKAHENGHGYEILGIKQWVILYWLYTIEYANFNSYESYNSQSSGSGFRQGGLGTADTVHTAATTGATLAYGNRTYVSETDNAEVRTYRGIENIYGNKLTIIDGVYFTNSAMYYCLNPSNYGTPSSYTAINVTSGMTSGYIDQMTFTAAGIFAPTSLLGGSTEAYCSSFVMNQSGSENKSLAIGGMLSGNANLITFGGKYEKACARLVFIP